ncbi:MAG: DUF3300 domain-containing protein [Gammaproteobacteria bacterium]
METNHRTLSLTLARRRPHVWWLAAALVLAFGAAVVKPVAAQQPAADKILAPADLQNVVGPIALYPDDLIGIVLPASTYPLQVVEAERFIEKRKQDPSLQPSHEWDDSVVALLNYPEAVHLLSDDLDWTWDLGTAVLNQRGDVLDAIQSFRTRARGAGNLRTDDHQTITTQTDGSIAIAPADPQVIYVPYYEPERVVVYQSEPVYSYYPWAYPVYYYPYPAGYRFRTGSFWGVTSYFSIGWHSHLLNVHYWGHDDFPYFGWNYYAPYYARSYINVNVNVPRGGSVWEPRRRYGDRPNVPSVRGRDGRVADSRPEPHYGNGVGGSASRYRNAAPNANRSGAPVTTAPRAGGVAGSASRYRPPQQNAAPNAATPQPNRDAADAGGANRGVPPTRTREYRSGGGMSQSSRQNDTSQRFMTQPPRATPAPQTESRANTAAPRYRIPTAPERQPQSAAPSPQREYRGMSSASRAAPAARSAPPRSESVTAAPNRGEARSAPRNEGGSSRGGGDRAPQQHGGRGNGGGRSGGGGRGGESRER